MWITKLEEKVEKMVAVFETMAFEHVAGNSVNYNENTCGAVNMLPNSP